MIYPLTDIRGNSTRQDYDIRTIYNHQPYQETNTSIDNSIGSVKQI